MQAGAGTVFPTPAHKSQLTAYKSVGETNGGALALAQFPYELRGIWHTCTLDKSPPTQCADACRTYSM
ncbi:MAG: hypothetical protein MJZ76_06690 [Bacteroidales bacterium]|nr:hypothetical protein [Bacteroidales bacterium]